MAKVHAMGERGASIEFVRSTFLFANPSVIEGLARIVDLGATFDAYNDSATPVAADLRALAQDWYAVGRDVQDVYEQTARGRRAGD